MVEYKCKVCKYSTNRTDNYSRHMKSKKHLQKNNTYNENIIIPNGSPIGPPKNESILCKYCENTFSRSDKLTKHLKYCRERFESEIQLKEKIKQLEEKVKLIEDIKLSPHHNNTHENIICKHCNVSFSRH